MIIRENLIRIGKAGVNTSNRETPDQIGIAGGLESLDLSLSEGGSFRLLTNATLYYL